jgi:FkbM family methyltransferase
LKNFIRQFFQLLGYSVVRAKPDSFQVQAALIPKPRVIFDVGAHIGETARRYRSLFPLADVYSFEPFPNSFNALNSCLPGDAHFHPQNCALADIQGQAFIHSNKSSATNSLLPTSHKGPDSWGDVVDTVRTVSVPVDTIDAFCSVSKISQIDILKLDVQGAELRALRGAHSMLSNGFIAAIYTEVLIAHTYEGQGSFEDIMRLLRECGYSLYDIQNLCYRKGPLLQFDALFLRHDHPAF